MHWQNCVFIQQTKNERDQDLKHCVNLSQISTKQIQSFCRFIATVWTLVSSAQKNLVIAVIIFDLHISQWEVREKEYINQLMFIIVSCKSFIQILFGKSLWTWSHAASLTANSDSSKAAHSATLDLPWSVQVKSPAARPVWRDNHPWHHWRQIRGRHPKAVPCNRWSL